jgi:phosphatidylserine/phosphatidylglycerophosphate/cardiolipin synthase-like enzyme
VRSLAGASMANDFEVEGNNAAAAFTLKVHRGEGMVLLAMNWKEGKPPIDLVGFAIEYREPGGNQLFALNNRLAFPDADGAVDPRRLSTRSSPIQMFRWVHFPRNAELPGAFTYQVSPVFMNDQDQLRFGEPQTAALELRRETYPGQLNVAFTRGFVSSQAFVDRYASAGKISTLLPPRAADGLTFVPTHPNAKQALAWMGFEARSVILEVLDQAIADEQAQVRVIAYDLNEPEVLSRLERLGARLRVIIDDEGDHGAPHSAENQAEARLVATAGASNVKRQHMGHLQHNKTIVVDGPGRQTVVCGSTNFSWRGFYVQSNNAVVCRGPTAVARFGAAFDDYWKHPTPETFGPGQVTHWRDLGLEGIDAKVAFSPHLQSNALLEQVADDVRVCQSSLFYSLAFLYQTPGAMRDAIQAVSSNDARFVYGMSDRQVGGLDLQSPDGNVAPVYPSALTDETAPEPFRSEPTGGGGIRLHHKFLVIDFELPSARVYLGSYNFSIPADLQNGENLLVVRDRRVAVSYMIEAVRIFDHYRFRLLQAEAKKANQVLQLKKPPRKAGELPWWAEHYQNPRKIRDRLLFA